MIFNMDGQESNKANKNSEVNKTVQDNDTEAANNNSQENINAIKNFINNESYSEYISARKIDDWAHGPRYKVNTSEDKYIFYLYENKIAGVWGDNAAGNFVQLYKNDVVPELPENVEVEATEELPKYIILDQMKRADGGKHADILIKSMDPDDPFEKKKEIFKKIIKKENLKTASFYSTREAFKANMNSDYSKENPNALENGLLGSKYDGEFYE